MKVETGIARWHKWLNKIGEALELAQAERDVISERIEGNTELRRLGALDEEQLQQLIADEKVRQRLDAGIKDLLEQENVGKQNFGLLQRFRSALVTVQQGLPDTAFDVLDEAPNIAESASSTSVSEDTPDAPAADISFGSRRAQLERVAQQHGMSASTCFIITLFETACLPDDPPQRRRGLIKVLKTAEKLLLLESFGWKNLQETLTDNWTTNNPAVKRYLRYGGAPGGRNHVFWRPAEALPWKAGEILTEHEMDNYRSCYQRSK